MRKMKIHTKLGLDETEGLFNTVDDRWSRRAKHPLSKTELINATAHNEFNKGDIVVYEGQEVEVRIPVGPNNTAGIMLEGHLRMVDRKTLQLGESVSGVMGGLKPMNSINRMMQLAGLELSGTVVENTTDIQLDEDAAAGTMFKNLLQANINNPRYKNNPDAAKIATVGQVLAGMQEVLQELPKGLSPSILNQLKMVPGIGVNLINAADEITKSGMAAAGSAAE